MCEELGDMLMQVLFNIHMAEDLGYFTMSDVTSMVTEKLIYRHPHVFGDVNVKDSAEVLVNWEALKRKEKGQSTAADAVDAVARSLPALWRAEKMQNKAAKAGFDFPSGRALSFSNIKFYAYFFHFSMISCFSEVSFFCTLK